MPNIIVADVVIEAPMAPYAGINIILPIKFSINLNISIIANILILLIE